MSAYVVDIGQAGVLANVKRHPLLVAGPVFFVLDLLQSLLEQTAHDPRFRCAVSRGQGVDVL
jgi:hypothetical protein